MKDKRLWIIFLIIFVNLLGFGIIMPLMPYYVESFGAGPITVGLVAAAYSFFQIISAPILGELSDKFGRRPILLISIAGTAVSFLLLGVAKTIPILFLSRIIDGATGGNISTAQAYIADITSKKDRTQGMGMMMAAFSLGFILGPAIGGLLSVYGYAVPAFVAGAIALIATILTYFYLPESHSPQVHLENKKFKVSFFSVKDFYDALTHPEVGFLLTISFLTMLGASLMQGTFALFTQHSMNLSAQTNGLIFAYMGIVGITIQMLFMKRILKLIPEHKIVTLSIMCLAVSLALIAVSTNIPMLLLAITILSFGNGLSGPIIAGQISKLTPDSEQGNVSGLNQSVTSVARLIGPIAGTLLYSSLGMKSPYFIATIILILTATFAFKKLKPVEELV